MPRSTSALLEWQAAYQESLRKYGSVSVEVTRTIFVGPSAAGKSTLKHLLVHNKPNKAITTSTAVMATPEVVTKRSDKDALFEQYIVGENTSAWQLVDSDVMKKALRASIANRAYKEKERLPEMRARGTEDGQHEAIVEEQMDANVLPNQLKPEDRSDMALLNEQYSQLLEGMEEGKHFELNDAFFIHLLDTGGQPSFQDVLPLLLDVPCTYIQVFNASRSLYERIPITYRPNDHTVVHLDDAENGRDMMLRSFSSMQTMAQKCSKELASFRRKDSPSPQLCIFVVGTHKDELINQGRLAKATEEIRAFLGTLKGKPYYNSIQWDSKGQQFFLINAMAVNDRDYVNDLRERISSEGSLKLDVPVMWFLCQEVTRCTPKKFFRLQDLEAFCQEEGFVDGENAASQFRALLQLFSLLGFYSFFNLKGVPDKDNFVCTDTGVFLKEVSKLLAVQFTAPISGRMRDFKETGILVDISQLSQDLEFNPDMNPKWFLHALQHLGIAARLPSKDRLEYFIPAALPQKSAILDPSASVAPLCLTYTIKEGAVSSYSDMPRGVFCRLAVELIRKEWDIVEDESSRSLLKFEGDEFTIFLQEFPGYISVIPQAVVKFSSPSALHTACLSLRNTITQCLSVSTEEVLGSQFSSHANLAMGFTCNCKEKVVPHLAILTPSKQGIRFKCTRKHARLTCSSQHLIWFSPVDGVEVSIS